MCIAEEKKVRKTIRLKSILVKGEYGKYVVGVVRPPPWAGCFIEVCTSYFLY
jgi:hypothetical protein